MYLIYLRPDVKRFSSHEYSNGTSLSRDFHYCKDFVLPGALPLSRDKLFSQLVYLVLPKPQSRRRLDILSDLVPIDLSWRFFHHHYLGVRHRSSDLDVFGRGRDPRLGCDPRLGRVHHRGGMHHWRSVHHRSHPGLRDLRCVKQFLFHMIEIRPAR